MTESITVALPDRSPRTFHHRGTEADLGVIDQIFTSEDYSFARLARGAELAALHDDLARAGQRPLIIDSGANIGASALYFALRFPAAHIVALEPDAGNFDLLLRNTAGLDVEGLQAGIASRDGRAALHDPGMGEWGYRTVRDGAGAVQTPLIGCSRLVAAKTAAGFVPFIAKIDIEGAEAELFSADTAWIDAFPLLIVELHDWLLPGQGSARNFIRCMAERDRDFVYIGENVFSIRNSP